MKKKVKKKKEAEKRTFCCRLAPDLRTSDPPLNLQKVPVAANEPLKDVVLPLRPGRHYRVARGRAGHHLHGAYRLGRLLLLRQKLGRRLPRRPLRLLARLPRVVLLHLVVLVVHLRLEHLLQDGQLLLRVPALDEALVLQEPCPVAVDLAAVEAPERVAVVDDLRRYFPFLGSRLEGKVSDGRRLAIRELTWLVFILLGLLLTTTFPGRVLAVFGLIFSYVRAQNEILLDNFER